MFPNFCFLASVGMLPALLMFLALCPLGMALSTSLQTVLKRFNVFGVTKGAELITAIDSQFGRNLVTKAADYPVVAADNGKTFAAITGAVNFTLPLAAAGLSFDFIQTTDNNMAILAPSSNDSIFSINDVAADSIAYSTAGNKIGSHAKVVAITLDSGVSYKWFASNPGGTTRTVT
jgi:hypothetical protein